MPNWSIAFGKRLGNWGSNRTARQRSFAGARLESWPRLFLT